jgi:hypothetical protein
MYSSNESKESKNEENEQRSVRPLLEETRRKEALGNETRQREELRGDSRQETSQKTAETEDEKTQNENENKHAADEARPAATLQQTEQQTPVVITQPLGTLPPSNAQLEVLMLVQQSAPASARSPLIANFRRCLASLVRHSSLRLRLHLVGEPDSLHVASAAAQEVAPGLAVVEHDARLLTQRAAQTAAALRTHFAPRSGYYAQALFLLAPLYHRLLPTVLGRLLVLDVDLLFAGDVAHVAAHFAHLQGETLVALAHEQQPVYRHVLSTYRRAHPGTPLGEPAAAQTGRGQPGYNSGVLLLNLAAMRGSAWYNGLLDTPGAVEALATEYSFRGHLGDQDLWTLLAFVRPQTVHALSCGLNRQLCEWWRGHGGYTAVFDDYWRCDAEAIVVWHGNCNTPFPAEALAAA